MSSLRNPAYYFNRAAFYLLPLATLRLLTSAGIARRRVQWCIAHDRAAALVGRWMRVRNEVWLIDWGSDHVRRKQAVYRWRWRR